MEGGLEKSAPRKKTSSSLSSSPASEFPVEGDGGGREKAARNRSEDGRLLWRESIAERDWQRREKERDGLFYSVLKGGTEPMMGMKRQSRVAFGKFHVVHCRP